MTGQSTVLVTAPNGGETWAQGETHQVSWHAPYATSPITIDLHRKTGGCSPCYATGETYVKNIASNLPNTGLFQWAIPRELSEDDYFIIVYESDKPVEGDTSDRSFRIGQGRQEGAIFAFENEKFIAKLRDGAVIYLKNKRTGTEYISNSGTNSDVKTSVLFRDGAVHNTEWQPNQDVTYPQSSQVILGEPLNYSANADNSSVAWYFANGNQQTKINVSLDPKNQDLIFSMETKGTRRNLHRLRYALTGIDHNNLDIILPAKGGIRIKKGEENLKRDYLIWPLNLNAQFVILQGNKEGFWVRSDDTNFISKGVELDRQSSSDKITFGFDTEAPTPFDNQTNLTSVTWRISTYDGDWTLPVHQYRLWMEKNYEIPKRPDWVKSIKLAIWGAPIGPPGWTEVLEDLSIFIRPEHILVGSSGWRKDTWATNFPYYDVDPNWLPQYNFMIEKGYKVMLYVNPFTTEINNEIYDRFKELHAKDPITNTPWPSWDYARGKAYIPLASDAWRKEIITRVKEGWDKINPKPSALYIDESFFALPHYANGVIDGKSEAEGNIQMHKDFINNFSTGRRNDGLILTGELINEVSFRHEAFTMGQAFGSGFVLNEFGQNTYVVNKDVHHLLIPINSLLFGPHTKIVPYGVTGGTDEKTLDTIKAFEILRYEPQINPVPWSGTRNKHYICENELRPIRNCTLNAGFQRLLDRATGKTQHASTLTQAQVKPLPGRNSGFIFSVVYKDEDGEGPGTENYSYVRAVIDGIPYDLTPGITQATAQQYKRGIKFSIQKNGLSNGRHNYHFEAWDTWKIVRYPTTGNLEFNVPSIISSDSGFSERIIADANLSETANGEESVHTNFSNFTSGTNVSIAQNQGEVIAFSLDGTAMPNITFARVTADSVILTIGTTSNTISLRTGETQKADVNGDGKYDIEIKLESITKSGKANVFMKKVLGETPKEIQTKKEIIPTTNKKEVAKETRAKSEDLGKILWVGFGMVILAFMILILKRKK